MTNVMNVQIEMVAPEKWRQDEWLARSENIARGGLAMPLRHDPMFHSDTSRTRIGPACDIAGSKNSRDICLQEFVNQNAIVSRDACLFGNGGVWTHADTDDHQIAIQFGPVIE